MEIPKILKLFGMTFQIADRYRCFEHAAGNFHRIVSIAIQNQNGKSAKRVTNDAADSANDMRRGATHRLVPKFIRNMDQLLYIFQKQPDIFGKCET